MLLRASPVAFPSHLSSSLAVRSHPCSLVFAPTSDYTVRVSASVAPEQKSLTGVVFEPFVEVQNQLVKVPPTSAHSLARQEYSPECEAAINEQINVEYNASYVYHALFAYFDRDNVALPGFAKFFKESSDEERMHAENLMKYQVEDIKKISEYVAHLRRVGKGHGVYHFDLILQGKEA